MTELRARDLRFTIEGIGPVLSPDVRRRFDRRPGEGARRTYRGLGGRLFNWLVYSLQGREASEDFIQSFSGSNTFILDYLAEEVLQQLPGEWVEFLLHTSTLDRLTAPLCYQVTGLENSQALLEQLQHANLFLFPLDNERQWYRYHHLFADFLRSRLIHQEPEKLKTLHLTASRWFEEHGVLREAVQHALSAADFERVAALIEPISLEAGRSDYHWIDEWASKIPESTLKSYPNLCYWYAWALLATGQVEKVDRLIQIAEETWRAVPANLGKLLSVRCNVALLRGQISETIAWGEKALRLIDPEDHYSVGGTLVPIGGAYFQSGALDQAETTLSQAVAECRAGEHYMSELYGMNLLADTLLAKQELENAEWTSQQILTKIGNQLILHKGKALIRLGEIALVKGEINQALDFVHEGIQFRQNVGMERYQAEDYMVLARVFSAKGDRLAAVQALDQAENIARSIGHIPDLARVNALRGQVMENIAPIDKNWDKTNSKISTSDTLTTRELEILRLIQAGFSNQQIAEKLFLTTGTVKLHIHHIYSKLDAGSRTQALSRGRELGLL